MKFDIWMALAVIMIVILGATGWYLYQMNQTANLNVKQLTSQRTAMEEELKNVYKQKQSIESEIKDIKSEKETLINKINSYEDSIDKMKAENEIKVRDLTAEVNKLKTNLAQREKSLPGKDAEIKMLKSVIESLKSKLALATKKMESDPSGASGRAVNLQPITVRSSDKKITGAVLEANQEYGFIVVSAGSAQGVTNGDVLFVLRDKALLGKVVVEKVSDSVSIAKILQKSLSDEVRKGDMVSN